MFSLCFGSVEGDGVLMLGDVELPAGIELQYTQARAPARAGSGPRCEPVLARSA